MADTYTVLQVAHINPFLQAGLDALDQLVGGGSQLGMIAVRSALLTTEKISALVEFEGQSTGLLLVSMSQVTATIIASIMFEERHVAFGTAAESAITELANMISGSATTMLADAGWECEIRPSRMVRGIGSEVARLHTLVLPIYAKCGRVDLCIAFTPTDATTPAMAMAQA
jgi:chemotaxis protein CheX